MGISSPSFPTPILLLLFFYFFKETRTVRLIIEKSYRSVYVTSWRLFRGFVTAKRCGFRGSGFEGCVMRRCGGDSSESTYYR